MTEIILRSTPDKQKNKSGTSGKFAARGKKIVTSIITIFLATATLTFGLGVSGTPETSVNKAYAMDNGCSGGWVGMDSEGSERAKHRTTSGWGGALGSIRPNFEADRAYLNEMGASPGSSGKFTAYEWYGVSGFQLYPGTWFPNSGCSKYSELNPINGIAGMIQSGTNFFGEALLGIVSLAMDASIVNELIAGEDSIASRIIGSLQNSLYLNWVIPIIILAGAGIAYSGLVKKRATEATQGTVWVIVSAALAMVFFAQPTQIATWADETVVSLGNEIMSATAAAASGTQTSEDPLCGVPSLSDMFALGTVSPVNSGRDAQLRTSQCILWKTFIYEPWAAAQFGPLANSTEILVPDSAAATFRSNRTLPIVFLDNRTLNRAEVVTSQRRDVSLKEGQFNEFKNTMQQDSTSAGWANFSGNPGDVRLGPTLVGFIGMAAGLGPITYLSITLVAQQIFMLLLLLVAPIVFTIGIFPGRGRKIMLGWFEIFLSTVIKRFIAYLLIALLLVALTVVMSTETSSSSFLLQIALVASIGFGTLVLRKIILEKFGTISLGGDGGQMMTSVGRGAMAEATGKGQLASDYKKGRGLVTQPIANFGKAISQDKSVWAATKSAAKGFGKGYRTGGTGVGEAINAIPKGYEKRDGDRTKTAVKEAAKKEVQEKAEFDARAKITEQRRTRKDSSRTIKGTARLNDNLEELNKNIGGAVPKRPDMSRNEQNSSEDSGSGTGREADYSNSIDKMQEKLAAIELRKSVLEDWRNQLDAGLASGEYDEVSARERKNIIQNEMYGLYEESELLQRKIERTE